ncbi:MAG: diguanylate cyclase [Candidatus Omnitrophica bacterium]|nr:diguanylate cyclase [Candidatus Omnitrophota bacterium]MDD5436783.1 diguanylate cyclase [Candidatus Omnitrophota bacterium]
MHKLRLQVRITLLIAGLSFLFISAFTYIQLNNHLERLNSYNKYRARVGTIIVKTTLEMLLKGVTAEEAIPSIFDAAINSLSKEGIADRISIMSMDGNAVATNDPIIKEFGESKEDINTYFRLSRSSETSEWFYSIINAKTKMIDIYIPIWAEKTPKYIAKLSFSIANITKAMLDIFIPIGLTAVAVIIGNLFLAFVLVKTVVRPIRTLNRATKEIASGNLDLNVKINTHDEIQELGDTFNIMTTALKKMKDKAENANPLTKLPGNTVIREEVERRIKKNEKFVAIHVDLDNFKSYNDRYGIAKGDEIIKFTSKVLESALKMRGTPGDFIGHEGGDDFFLVTSLDTAETVSQEIITEFDSRIRSFYSPEDQQAGFILEKSRQGEMVKFPIMTISLAGVTNQIKPILNYAELTNIAVGVKHKVKEVQKSTFLLDRRTQ